MKLPVVVWWTIDSLRRDVCSVYGGPANTPTLQRLASSGQAFEGRAEATWTLPSVTSILTGVTPSEHGVVSEDDQLGPGVPTLPQYFRASGWRTVGIVANPWFTRKKGLDVGFDYFYNITEDGSLLRQVSVRSLINYLVRIRSLNGGLTLDRDRHPSEPLIADLASERLGASPRPVFLFVHTQGAHSPYQPPPSWDKHSANGDGRRAAYLNLVEFVDAQLARFIRTIDENALIIVTSDHGEAHGESGKWGHKDPSMDLLYDVPLIINQSETPFINPVNHLDVHRWLRDEVAPDVNAPERSDEIQERLEALGYVDGEHSV